MDGDKAIVTLSVADRNAVGKRTMAAMRGEDQGAHITFASVDLLWRVLTPKRWAILQAMAGQGAMSIRAIARSVGRDVKAVHGDAHALLDAGILQMTEQGMIFPYDGIHVDFTLHAAA